MTILVFQVTKDDVQHYICICWLGTEIFLWIMDQYKEEQTNKQTNKYTDIQVGIQIC